MANEELRIQNINRTLAVSYNLFLNHGIESVTREMIARESGLSRKSIERYYPTKIDCIIRVAEWVSQKIRERISSRYPDSFFTDGNHTGIQLMRMYLMDLKELFFDDPRVFVIYSEFKLYIYRHSDDFEKDYTLMGHWMGNHHLRQKIYKLGRKDGSMSKEFDLDEEEEYLCESFFGFLGDFAMSISSLSKEFLDKRINRRIDNTIAIYKGKLEAI